MAWVPNGQAIPIAKRKAPIGGPRIWLATMKPEKIRAFPMPRSSGFTSIGSRVEDVVSAKTSPTPSRNIATRTTVMLTWPVAITTASPPATTTRAPSAAITSRRRSTRSATAPA